MLESIKQHYDKWRSKDQLSKSGLSKPSLLAMAFWMLIFWCLWDANANSSVFDRVDSNNSWKIEKKELLNAIYWNESIDLSWLSLWELETLADFCNKDPRLLDTSSKNFLIEIMNWNLVSLEYRNTISDIGVLISKFVWRIIDQTNHRWVWVESVSMIPINKEADYNSSGVMKSYIKWDYNDYLRNSSLPGVYFSYSECIKENFKKRNDQEILELFKAFNTFAPYRFKVERIINCDSLHLIDNNNVLKIDIVFQEDWPDKWVRYLVTYWNKASLEFDKREDLVNFVRDYSKEILRYRKLSVERYFNFDNFDNCE